jgi:hypothetical protein
MKRLILALALMLPLTASALETGGALTCELANGGQVTFHLISGRGGLTQEGAKLTIVANGILHTVLDTVITKVNPARGRLDVDVKTLNARGETDANSGEANISVALQMNPDDTIRGIGDNAVITLTKQPVDPPFVPGNIRFQDKYELTGCKGTL